MKIEKIVMTGSKNLWSIKMNDGKYLGEHFGEFGKTFAAWKTKKDATIIFEYIKIHGVEETLKKINEKK